MRGRWRVAIVIVVVAIVWILGGAVRAGPAARDWFAGHHGSGASLVNVEVDGVSPAIPLFWRVTISGDVVEAGNTSPSYRPHMILWIEPFTGWPILRASG